MAALDWWVILSYLGGTVALSAWLARRQSSAADYYVGGRTLPWWALSLSILATQSSANSFIGIPAYVALVPGGGLTWLQYELALPLALVVVILVLVPVLRGLAVISVYEYLERRFDSATRLSLSAVFLLSRGLATGVALYAAALVVQVCTGLSLAWSIVLMGGLTVIYDTLGGMRAVVWTDVVQMAVLLAGIVLCGSIAWQLAGGGAAILAAHDPARLAALEWGHGLGDGARAPLWGFLAGGLVLYIAYYGVDQSQAQRMLSAPSVQGARRALLLNGLLRFPLTLLYAGLGLAIGAVALQQPALRDAVPAGRLDLLVPRFIELYLPPGARGLLVAAILAAAMSSLDSALNSLSAATLRDFVEPRVGPARALLAGRLVTVAWGLLIIGFAFAVGDLATSVVEGINRIGALFYGPLLAAFLAGILDRRARGPAVLAGVAAGLAANAALAWGLGAQLFWMWWNISGLVVAVAVTWVGSRLLAPPAPQQLLGTTLDGAALRQQWRDSRGSIGLLLAWAAAMGAAALALGVR
jgi:SSS family solute:Na+ symporter